MTFERKIQFDPGFDKRSNDPKTNYGIHGMQIRFILKGPKGAIQFMIMTDWQLPHVRKEMQAKHGHYFSMGPMPADVGYHSYEPRYDGQEPISQTCEILDGKPCYYDGSSLCADELFDIFVTEGEGAMWKYLENVYQETFA